MTTDSRGSRKDPRGPDDPVITLRKPDGGLLSLTMNEFRLALLALVDFEGDWDALLTASAFVPDAAGKAALVRDRLRPVADMLPPLLNRGIDSLELLSARHWFRNGRL